MRLECRVRSSRHRIQREPLVNDPSLHHGTCDARAVMHVGIANPRRRVKRSRHSRRMRNLAIWQEARGVNHIFIKYTSQPCYCRAVGVYYCFITLKQNGSRCGYFVVTSCERGDLRNQYSQLQWLLSVSVYMIYVIRWMGKVMSCLVHWHVFQCG